MVPIIRNQSLVGYPTVLPSGHLASPFFTKLPAQLRLAIYKYVFDDSTVLARIERPGDYRVTELRPNRQSILLTCHAIYSEVLHVYWSHTGTLHAVQYSSQQCYCHRPPKRCLNKSFPLPQNVREHIKHVVLDSPPFGRRRSIEAQESLCEFLSKFRSLRTCDLGLETILVPHKVSPRSFDWASVATRGQTPQERLARHVGLRLACTTEIQFTQEFKYMRRARAVKSLKVLKVCRHHHTRMVHRHTRDFHYLVTIGSWVDI